MDAGNASIGARDGVLGWRPFSCPTPNPRATAGIKKYKVERT